MMSDFRRVQYKNTGKNTIAKNQRSEKTILIRKNKTDITLSKRRNIESKKTDEIESDSFINCTSIQIIELATSNDASLRLRALKQAHKMIFLDESSYADEIINSDIHLSILVNCLLSDNADIQFEAARILTNIASGTSEQTAAVVHAGAVPNFLRLLASGNINVCEQAVWALGNIIGDDAHFRDYCLQLGILQPLLAFINPEIPLCFLRNVTWIFLKLCKVRNPIPSVEAAGTIINALAHLINHKDTSIIEDTIWALAYLSSENKHIQIIIDSGVVPKLVQLLANNEVKIQTAALRAVGNIVTGSNDQTQLVLDCGVLEQLPQLLNHHHEKINKEAAWLISNITTGSHTQIQSIFKHGLFSLMINLLDQGDYYTQKEVAYTVSNIAFSGSENQISTMIASDVLPPFCNLLTTKDIDIIKTVLDGVLNILKRMEHQIDYICLKIEDCGGLEKIEALQHHSNKEIYEITYEIIYKYFNSNEDKERHTPILRLDTQQEWEFA